MYTDEVGSGQNMHSDRNDMNVGSREARWGKRTDREGEVNGISMLLNYHSLGNKAREKLAQKHSQKT